MGYYEQIWKLRWQILRERKIVKNFEGVWGVRTWIRNPHLSTRKTSGPVCFQGMPIKCAKGRCPGLVRTLSVATGRKRQAQSSCLNWTGAVQERTTGGQSPCGRGNPLNETLANGTYLRWKNTVRCGQIESTRECKVGTTLRNWVCWCHSSHEQMKGKRSYHFHWCRESIWWSSVTP